MFSQNEKISTRQTFRLFVFDLIGLSTLVLPTYLARMMGLNGLGCIVIGGFFGWLYLSYLVWGLKKMGTDVVTLIEEKIPLVLRKLLYVWLWFHSLVLAGYCGYVFTNLMKQSLIQEENYYLILTIILITSAYAVSGGIESRARVYEIVFWFVLIPLLCMLLFSAGNIEPLYFTQTQETGALNILKGSYFVFLFFSVIFYALFFTQYLKDKRQPGKIYRAISGAIFLTVILLLVLYFLLIGNFGVQALKEMQFPVVTLMSTVKITGGFMKRLDAFMLAVWFFTLFALLNLLLFYGSSMLEKTIRKMTGMRKVIVSAVLVFLLAGGFHVNGKWTRYLLDYMVYVAVPVMLILPICFFWIGRKKQKSTKAKGMFLLLLVVSVTLTTTACQSKELEKRCFPMLVGIDYKEKEEQVTFQYSFPNLSQKTDTPLSAIDINVSQTVGKDFETAMREYENSINKEVDYNHMKVFLIGEKFLEQTEQYQEMLSLLQEMNLFPRNAYVCVVEDVETLMKGEENFPQDAGTYIEEFLENQDEHNGKKLPTLGKLFDEKENRIKKLYLPYLIVKEGTVEWEGYYVIERGIPSGKIK